MNVRSASNRLRIVAAILAVSFVISASTLFVVLEYGLGARTETETETEMTTVTITTNAVELYRVTFNETGGCYPVAFGYFYERWYVTMDSITIVQPSNVTLSEVNNQTGGRSGIQYQPISTIVFTVPDGNYSYYASNSVSDIGSGFVNVSGSNVEVPIASGPYCP